VLDDFIHPNILTRDWLIIWLSM